MSPTISFLPVPFSVNYTQSVIKARLLDSSKTTYNMTVGNTTVTRGGMWWKKREATHISYIFPEQDSKNPEAV
jgi:hypothetical protein